MQTKLKTQHLQGIGVSQGIAVGRAVLFGRDPVRVHHYLVIEQQIEKEVMRLRQGFQKAIKQVQQLQKKALTVDDSNELTAFLDLHLMLLQDPSLRDDATQLIRQDRYNAEWALTLQLGYIVAEFERMNDEYLRERKADIEQLVVRVLDCMQSGNGDMESEYPSDIIALDEQLSSLQTSSSPQLADLPPIVVAKDLFPTDILHFRQHEFVAFITETGGTTSHTSIIARSMEIPAVVAVKNAREWIKSNDCLIVHAETGQVIINPDAGILAEYERLRKDDLLLREKRQSLLYQPALSVDQQPVELLANIELASDCATSIAANVDGIGLFRTEFLFMDKKGALPDEQEQYLAYCAALKEMPGLPVTIRTVDIGADKQLNYRSTEPFEEQGALGLRAIRWSLSQPEMFLTQLRAILRASVHGNVNILFPMLGQIGEIRKVMGLVEQARQELYQAQVPFGEVQLGAMIEVPAAALMIDCFLQYFDFISIGTNDLTQYTLAVDRDDESVAHLFDPTHPAVLRLVAKVIQAGRKYGKKVTLCGEMAGDPRMTGLLLGFGLRSFSMLPAQILSVKEQILKSDTQALREWVKQVLAEDEPQLLLKDKFISKV